MPDQVFRFIAGNFSGPNSDNTKKVNPSYDVNAGELSVQNQAIQTFIIQQIKGGSSAVVSRVGRLTGNRSLARNLSFVSNIKGDILTVGTGFATGGLVGVGIAGVAIGVQKGLEAFDIVTTRRMATIESNEQARRASYVATSKRGEYR